MATRRSTHSVPAAAGALALACVLAACANQVTTDATSEPADERVTLSEAVLADALADDEPGCSAAVALDGQVAWADAVGMADLTARTPLDTATVFNIGSVSKQFTATAVLILVEQGELALDDRLSAVLPELPAWADEVTISHLMHHTSGLDDVVYRAPPSLLNDEDVLGVIAADTLIQVSDPGTFAYSNTNYVLLAQVVRRVTGEEFPAWMAEHVFEPLGLEMAVRPGDPPKGTADPYAVDDGFVEGSLLGFEASGPTGIMTTPSELARWGDHYRAPEVIERATLDGALGDTADAGDGWTYGPGIFLAPGGGLRHGGVDGHISAFDVSPDRSATIAISCNRDDVDLDAMSADLSAIWSDAATG